MRNHKVTHFEIPGAEGRKLKIDNNISKLIKLKRV